MKLSRSPYISTASRYVSHCTLTVACIPSSSFGALTVAENAHVSCLFKGCGYFLPGFVTSTPCIFFSSFSSTTAFAVFICDKRVLSSALKVLLRLLIFIFISFGILTVAVVYPEPPSLVKLILPKVIIAFARAAFTPS